jgi:hypothetical protein
MFGGFNSVCFTRPGLLARKPGRHLHVGSGLICEE